MTDQGWSTARAAAVAARLRLDLGRTCLACLSVVSFAIDEGDEREVRRQVRHMTPGLWHDGLDVQAFAAVREARAAGVPDAEPALADLEAKGGRSLLARAIVRRLGTELAEREASASWLNPDVISAERGEGVGWS